MPTRILTPLFKSLAACLVFSLASQAPLLAVDFLRGDANSDGVVSFADADFICSFLYRGGPAPECEDAADVNDDGGIQWWDALTILSDIVENDEPTHIRPPFPAQGPDPSPEKSPPCDAYGGGEPVDDTAAAVDILDAVAPGGKDPMAVITVAVSSSLPIAGFFGRMTVLGDIFKEGGTWSGNLSDLTSLFADAYHSASVHGDRKLRLGLLRNREDASALSPGENTAVLEIKVSLRNGTLSGEYPLVFDAGELVDAASSRAIHPALASGTLRVLSTVIEEDPGEHLPPINVQFELVGASGPPGSEVTVPFFIRGDVGLEGYAFSINFNEEVLRAIDIERIYRKPDGRPPFFEDIEFNNDNNFRGSAGIEEGYVAGAVILDYDEWPANALPANQDNEVLAFRFEINPTTDATTTELRFLDGAEVSRVSPFAINAVTPTSGSVYIPGTADSFVLVNGVVNVLPDGALFIRGDANTDAKVDLSDAQTTLSYLFLGGSKPRCADAADANDDGRIDVSDPVATLQWLFLGADPLPPPGGSPGTDSTQDGLSCAHGL